MKPFILFINSSPRKRGKTVEYLKETMKWSKKEGAEVELIHLIDFKISPCLGCYSNSSSQCIFPCRQKDEMQKIYPLLLKANGIILGSPSYWFSVTGLLKNFIDRLTCLENNGFLLEDKVFSVISVAQETGGEEVGHYLISVFNDMGCTIPPFATPFFNNGKQGSWQKKDLSELGRNIVKLARVIKKIRFV